LSSVVGEAAWAGGKTVLVIVMAMGCVVAVYALSWLSLSPLGTVFLDRLMPQSATLRAYHQVIRAEQIGRYFGNTALVAVLTAVLVPLITFPAATALAGQRTGTSSSILTTIQATAVVGGMHALIPLYVMFRGLGLIDTIFPLIAIYVGHSLPFAVFAMTGYLRGLPASLRETAVLEGATRSVYTWRILAPLSLPVITIAAVHGFRSAWNAFLVPLLFLNDDARYTISVKLYSFVGSVGSANPRWDLFAAASVINLALVAVVLARVRRPLQTTDAAEQTE
jgi:ABC-type glycerol-3-phosphate transport system permease component